MPPVDVEIKSLLKGQLTLSERLVRQNSNVLARLEQARQEAEQNRYSVWKEIDKLAEDYFERATATTQLFPGDKDLQWPPGKVMSWRRTVELFAPTPSEFLGSEAAGDIMLLELESERVDGISQKAYLPIGFAQLEPPFAVKYHNSGFAKSEPTNKDFPFSYGLHEVVVCGDGSVYELNPIAIPSFNDPHGLDFDWMQTSGRVAIVSQPTPSGNRFPLWTGIEEDTYLAVKYKGVLPYGEKITLASGDRLRYQVVLVSIDTNSEQLNSYKMALEREFSNRVVVS